MVSRKYSYKTVKAYIYFNRDFLNFIGKGPSEMTDTDIKNYLVHLAEEKNSATSTLNQVINALKFYYGTILKMLIFIRGSKGRKDRYTMLSETALDVLFKYFGENFFIYYIY